MRKYATLPSLSLLRSFEAAARYENYTMAAEELGVTQGAVSRQVAELENTIGIALFRRVGRSVRLTQAGHAFFAEISADLDTLQDSVNRAIAGGAAASLLTLGVLPTFAARWLVPRLPAFKRDWPDVELALLSHTEPFNLEEKRVDVVIHFGHADWPGVHLSPLCPENLLVVAAPALFQAYKLETEANVFQAPLLHLSSRPGLWARYHAQLNTSGRDAFPGLRFDQFSLVIAGALAGLGVAILPTYLIENELAARHLVPVGTVTPAHDEGYFIGTPVGQTSEMARAFSGWIKRQVRGS